MPSKADQPQLKKAMAAAKKIKLLVLDLDGVMTDGGLYYDSAGQTTKRFHVHDGFGIKMAMDIGLEVAVITGLASLSARARMDKLGVRHYVEGQENKLGPLDEIRCACNLDWPELAYMGDDWVDLAPMAKVGLPVAVLNAQPEVLDAALYVTSLPGGSGAVREVINLILTAQGCLDKALERWKAL